jgi:hypothetical protein
MQLIYLKTLCKKIIPGTFIVLSLLSISASAEETPVAPQAPAWLPQDELAARGYKFPTAVNGDEVAKLYGVRGTPTTYFINKNNQVIFKYTSSDITDPRLELAVKEIVKNSMNNK